MFQEEWIWNEDEEGGVRYAFEFRGGKLLGDDMWPVHHDSNMRNDWIREDHLTILRKFWATKKYQEKCARNNKNQNSSRDGLDTSRHTGGSRLFASHFDDLKEKHNKKPRLVDLFAYRHSSKYARVNLMEETTDGDLNLVDRQIRLIDQRAQHTFDNFIKNMRVAEEESQANGSQPPNDVDIFIELAGRVRKRHVYGGGVGSLEHYLPHSSQREQLTSSQSTRHCGSSSNVEVAL